ncbi:MAG: hypothetical protein QM740_00615 [Acidovorax sp.]
MAAGTNRSSPYSQAEIEALWAALVEDARSPKKQHELLETLKIKRSLSSLIDRKIGLGVQLRWNLAMLILTGRAGPAPSEGKALLVKEVRKLLELTTDFFQLNHANSGSKKDDKSALQTRMATLLVAARDIAALERLCGVLAKRFRDAYLEALGVDQLTANQFLSPVFGPQAVQTFIHLLCTGHLPLEVHTTLVSQVDYIPSDERDHEFMVLLARLAGPTDRPIQGIAMPGSPSGQCAVAHELVRRLQAPGSAGDSDARPIVMLPCGRQYRNPHHCGLDFLVQNLLSFYERRELRHDVPSLSADEMQGAIKALRQHLCRRPIIVVLVGYEVVRGCQPALRRAIRDEPLAQLLPLVIHPGVGSLELPTAAATFQKTRWIIFSDGELDLLEPYCSKTIWMPPPPPEAEEKIFSMFTKEHRHIAQLREISALSPLPLSEAKACTALQMMELKQFRGPPFAGAYDGSELGNGILARFAEVVRTCAPPLEAAALHLIALAGAGLRHTTLWQCLHAWRLIPRPTGTLPCPALPEVEEAVAWMDELLDNYQRVIYDGIDESEPSLNPLDHPFEYVGHSAACNMQAELKKNDALKKQAAFVHRSLDFRFVEVREALTEDMRLHGPSWYVQSLHRVLANEALRQHALLVRHEAPQYRTALRDERRALEGLYHGLLALPEVDTLPETTPEPCLAHAAPASGLPGDSVAAFQFLRRVVFGNLLERKDQYRLSRRWAADDIKLDVLELIHLAFATTADRGAGLSLHPLWHARGLVPDAVLTLRQHCESIAVAAYGANDMVRWNDFTAGVGGMHELTGDIPLLKRVAFDMSMISHGPGADRTISMVIPPLEEMGVKAESFTRAPWRNGRQTGLVVPDPKELETFLADCLSNACHSPPAQWTSLSDWFVRLGELRYQQAQAKGARETVRWQLTMECFVQAQIATRLRMTTLNHEGLSGSSHLSARGIRLLARAALDLLRYLINVRADAAAGLAPTLREYLVAQARQALDAYALSRGYNEPDCAGMLILESRFARVAGREGPHRHRRHRIALDFLHEAEGRLSGMRTRHRLWLHLLIEHCATLRGLAAEAMEEPKWPGERRMEVARRLLGLALADVRQLENIIEAAYPAQHTRDDSRRALSKSWRDAVDHQRKLTHELIKKLPAG